VSPQTAITAVLLVFAGLAELLWAVAPREVSAHVQLIARTALIGAMAWAVWRAWRPLRPALAAVLVFIGFGFAGSAICAAGWLLYRWQIVAGVESCSHYTQVPIVVVSAILAALAAWFVDRERKQQGG
jgi:hypothetical protein